MKEPNDTSRTSSHDDQSKKMALKKKLIDILDFSVEEASG